MHTKYEVSIAYGLKVIVNVKVDNKRTVWDKQTDTTKTNDYAPDHSGIKIQM